MSALLHSMLDSGNSLKELLRDAARRTSCQPAGGYQHSTKLLGVPRRLHETTDQDGWQPLSLRELIRPSLGGPGQQPDLALAHLDHDTRAWT